MGEEMKCPNCGYEIRKTLSQDDVGYAALVIICAIGLVIIAPFLLLAGVGKYVLYRLGLVNPV
jgi:uncharacterized protein (DUF983 family)